MAAVLGRPEARATDSRYTSNAFLFSFEGRINRAKYWYAIVASSVACMVFLSIVAYAIGGIVMIALSLWGFVEMLTRGPNRFGPDPQAPVNRSPRAAPNWDQLRELEFVRRGAGPSRGSHVKRGHD